MATQRTVSRLLAIAFALFGVGLLAPRAEARIGESKATIERRLLRTGGVVYRDDAIEAKRRKGMPYREFLPLIPHENVFVKLYFKTAEEREPSSSELSAKGMPDGWDLHVVFVGGKSAVEVYHRSQPMSEYEANELLARQSGDSFWKRVKGSEKKPSAFGYEMVRDDGALRARRLGGDKLLIVSAELDKQLAQNREQSLIEEAPVSVRGF